MKKKTIRSITEGKEVYLIKLGNSGLEAKVDKEDWDLICNCSPPYATSALFG